LAVERRFTLRPASEVKHLLINLYNREFGGDPDALEVWDGPSNTYLVMRKEDGWMMNIGAGDLDAFLSADKEERESGKESIIKAFYNFKKPIDDEI
jgi:hypothetical protein